MGTTPLWVTVADHGWQVAGSKLLIRKPATGRLAGGIMKKGRDAFATGGVGEGWMRRRRVPNQDCSI